VATESSDNSKGLIGWFASNSVAANLLMLTIVAAGAFALLTRQIPVEVFPDYETRTISIRIPYRGGTPEEVEETVVIRVEEAITEVEGVERMTSTASSGSGTVLVEIDEDYDLREALDDVKSAVDAIPNLPAEAEKPVFSLGSWGRSVVSVVVHGPLGERELRSLGEQIRDELTALPDVTHAQLQGTRPFEISLEIDEETLRRHRLTMDQVARAIRSSAVDFTAGSIKSEGGDITLRTRGRAYDRDDFERIVIQANDQGGRVTLGDIAKVDDGFDENELKVRFNGEPCVVVWVFRSGDESAMRISAAVKDYIKKANLRLPEGVALTPWSDSSRIVKARLDTLIESGVVSAVLVFLVLSLFLRPGLAFWVTLGIPICFLGAISLMPFVGVSINITSLFGFILVLGIVVDDAIVTGENIFTQQMAGSDPVTASVRGAREVALPVIFGILTTVIAFLPLTTFDGFMGAMFGDIAWIVILVLLFSLVESKLILPAHLRHCNWSKPVPDNLFYRVQGKVAGAFNWVAKRLYRPLLERALHWRYLTIALFILLACILVGLVKGGRVTRINFPRVESERATCRLRMQEGTPYEVTAAAIDRIVGVAREIQNGELDPDGEPFIEDIIDSTGATGVSSTRGRGGSGQSHTGEVTCFLKPPEERPQGSSISAFFRTIPLIGRLAPDPPEIMGTNAMTQEWRKRIGPIVGAEELTFRAEIGRGGDPIDIQLMAPTSRQLETASAQVKERLLTYAGLFDVADSLDENRDEIQLRLRPEASHYRLTVADLGRQVRQAYYGEEVQRIVRGRDEIRVMLRYPLEDRRNPATLQRMMIRTPDGDEVPFSAVAEMEVGEAYSRIQRIDRNRAINVTADADKTSVDLEAISEDLRLWLDDLTAANPGLRWSFEGEARDSREASRNILYGAIFLFFAIYVMLAIPFRSYLQPLIVMLIIPFGYLGAVMGHMIMGIPLSMFSNFGILALAGIVVNDSLVLVDYVNRKRREGIGVVESVRIAGVARFRAILLTTLTTFAGLLPLLFLQSTQAQFLIPMAVSLAFGIVFATFITLLLVPATYLMLEDLKRGAKWVVDLYRPSRTGS